MNALVKWLRLLYPTSKAASVTEHFSSVINSKARSTLIARKCRESVFPVSLLIRRLNEVAVSDALSAKPAKSSGSSRFSLSHSKVLATRVFITPFCLIQNNV